MKVTFLLPGSSPFPSGGVKVVYEHANRFVDRGHAVSVVHAAFVEKGNFRLRARGVASYFLNTVGVLHWRPDRWFRIDERVAMGWVPSLAPQWISAGDAVVATSWQTAEWVRDYPQVKGRKFYFVQDYERYMEAGPDLRTRMAATYNAGLKNIVISPACRQMVESHGGMVACQVPNGLDLGVLGLKAAIDAPTRCLVGFPTRPEWFKGTRDAVKALELARSHFNFPFEVWSFGGPRPDYLPAWVNYYERPTDSELADLYNRTTIFVVPSLYEGWGLPGSEAMACGAALVSTDNGGVRAYADHEKTALLSPPGEPEALAANIMRLVTAQDLRARLAQSGYEAIRQFTWENANAALENCLLKGG
ncbi:glycosyltransferase family 4 protein [Geobacter sp.]|uniref:glycosyltransferase family 4 protein n=1 Tax=Geobacter sp. TaxID=46610 RepID=UPI00262410A3|nr:glycosyltransferase family 4 protein [Geobacter sp.]